MTAGMFIINSTTGVISLNGSLDYEAQTTWSFTAVAKDGGSPPLKDSSLIQLQVVDVNDNIPTFKKATGAVNITESSQTDREVFKVSADDKDSGLNAQLRYAIVQGNTENGFIVDPINGKFL